MPRKASLKRRDSSSGAASGFRCVSPQPGVVAGGAPPPPGASPRKASLKASGFRCISPQPGALPPPGPAPVTPSPAVKLLAPAPVKIIATADTTPQTITLNGGQPATQTSNALRTTTIIHSSEPRPENNESRVSYSNGAALPYSSSGIKAESQDNCRGSLCNASGGIDDRTLDTAGLSETGLGQSTAANGTTAHGQPGKVNGPVAGTGQQLLDLDMCVTNVSPPADSCLLPAVGSALQGRDQKAGAASRTCQKVQASAVSLQDEAVGGGYKAQTLKAQLGDKPLLQHESTTDRNQHPQSQQGHSNSNAVGSTSANPFTCSAHLGEKGYPITESASGNAVAGPAVEVSNEALFSSPQGQAGATGLLSPAQGPGPQGSTAPSPVGVEAPQGQLLLNGKGVEGDQECRPKAPREYTTPVPDAVSRDLPHTSLQSVPSATTLQSNTSNSAFQHDVKVTSAGAHKQYSETSLVPTCSESSAKNTAGETFRKISSNRPPPLDFNTPPQFTKESTSSIRNVIHSNRESSDTTLQGRNNTSVGASRNSTFASEANRTRVSPQVTAPSTFDGNVATAPVSCNAVAVSTTKTLPVPGSFDSAPATTLVTIHENSKGTEAQITSAASGLQVGSTSHEAADLSNVTVTTQDKRPAIKDQGQGPESPRQPIRSSNNASLGLTPSHVIGRNFVPGTGTHDTRISDQGPQQVPFGDTRGQGATGVVTGKGKLGHQVSFEGPPLVTGASVESNSSSEYSVLCSSGPTSVTSEGTSLIQGHKIVIPGHQAKIGSNVTSVTSALANILSQVIVTPTGQQVTFEDYAASTQQENSTSAASFAAARSHSPTPSRGNSSGYLITGITPGPRQRPAVSTATTVSNIPVIEEAFDFGGHYTAGVLQGLPPLFLAAAERNAATLRLLLKYGANANFQDDQGCTPLHLSASVDFQSWECAVVLIEHGAKVSF